MNAVVVVTVFVLIATVATLAHREYVAHCTRPPRRLR